jgi:hypothetical protein
MYSMLVDENVWLVFWEVCSIGNRKVERYPFAYFIVFYGFVNNTVGVIREKVTQVYQRVCKPVTFTRIHDKSHLMK